MAIARTESKGIWRVIESTGDAQTRLPFLTQPLKATLHGCAFFKSLSDLPDPARIIL
ncbi:MAG: hypothetical protein ACI8XO_004266 [Verrucomicrobiales bacterium]|jgi:hypothetical protein